MSIGITGASGQLGGAVVARLLDVVDAADVVLMSRTVESLSGFAARGVGVRPVDFGDAPSLAPAFEGVDSLLLISTDRVGDRVAGHVAAIEAAKDAGVRHVVYTSVPNPAPANPALAAPDHLATEDALRSSGMAWTSLRNNLYADMQLSSLRHAAEAGRLVVNSGDGRAAYVTRADCAAAAVGALTGGGRTNTAYDVTGPRALSAYDLAELTGAAVEVVQLDDEAYVEALVGSGLAKDAARFIASFGQAVREGYLADVTTAVRDLTGRRPTSLEDLVRPVEP